MIYYFDRYVNGKLMAQGAKITMAKSLEQALKIAKKLFDNDYKRGKNNSSFSLRAIK
jgi:hypothetical protein